MTKKQINQNDIYYLELLNSIEYSNIFENKPINRIQNKDNNFKVSKDIKLENLKKLKEKINTIEDCKFKKKANRFIFGQGNIDSSIMIVGGAPNKFDDESGFIFSGDDGDLLTKMLNAINIKKENTYITSAINYFVEENIKPSLSDINRYSIFLKEHISIINPKIIILMGTTAMQAITGINSKISMERGKWKETIIKNTNYILMITFDPSYLLRAPENKKYSWFDLKEIKKKMEDLNIES